ncbi:undecaprenyl-diphosphate phosphatase [Ferrimonas lipolytica]|uniref:Undecaprenyl-diphosphatase n=1 Tax=Ferrimonas lipolytica TaxID=2724191 RepID=A0A6H1UFD2_9GAMM|nr:undecaprenyl-diphosphate phosphatase [Ferrimonas lipolytica]QIZ77754.1 undecaprenyl-diphosphate phosphatase [Ferrimonas lipolytica]
MDLMQTVLLALLQGFTEFLPISSSAHLILPAQMLDWPDQGAAFDVAVHFGTLMAVVWYFRDDIGRLWLAWVASVKGNHSADGNLAWYIALGTVPAVIAGLLFNDIISTELRSTTVIASTTVIFGLALWYADASATERKQITDVTWKIALLIGIAQAVALIPGTSRSGITITMALLLGLSRDSAARFSFLLSVPIIVAASGKKALDLAGETVPVDWLAMGVGVALAFASAYACIYLFLKAISRMGMLPFVIYRLALGAVLFAFFV